MFAPTITKEQFEAYVEVRDSGLTNMFDVRAVIQLASDLSDTDLTKAECLEIMQHFGDYADLFKVAA